MAKTRNKSYILNREKYKAIKKYDHQQLEDFCGSIYESGYKNGYTNGCDTAAGRVPAGSSRGKRHWAEEAGRDPELHRNEEAG